VLAHDAKLGLGIALAATMALVFLDADLGGSQPDYIELEPTPVTTPVATDNERLQLEETIQTSIEAQAAMADFRKTVDKLVHDVNELKSYGDE
jgi:hypothetical protein